MTPLIIHCLKCCATVNFMLKLSDMAEAKCFVKLVKCLALYYAYITCNNHSSRNTANNQRVCVADDTYNVLILI